MNLRGIFAFLLRRAPKPAPLRFDDSTSIVPGMMVVCVSDNWGNHITDDGYLLDNVAELDPVKGRVYLVCDVIRLGCGLACLMLDGFPDCGYAARQFKPVRTTNISVFRDLLAPSEADRIALAALDGRAVEPVR